VNKINNKGFTLVEVMVATAILAFATVLIYRAFFICLDAFSYYANYLYIAPRTQETLWQAQDSLSRLGSLSDVERVGEIAYGNKRFNWDLSYVLIDEIKDDSQLYRIDMLTWWQTGAKRIEVSKTAYALFKQKR
jgi:prepilin-type N-terminal cleavage/methylation domain-containing protein